MAAWVVVLSDAIGFGKTTGAVRASEIRDTHMVDFGTDGSNYSVPGFQRHPHVQEGGSNHASR